MDRKADEVILQGELTRMPGTDAVFTLTGEQHRDYEHGRIGRTWLETRVQRFDQPFYLCGPPRMVEELSATLTSLGANAESLVFEA